MKLYALFFALLLSVSSLYSQATQIGYGYVIWMDFADMNGDGLTDMLTRELGLLNYYERIPEGSFEPAVTLFDQYVENLYAPGGFAIGDVDHDGDIDIMGIFGDQTDGHYFKIENQSDGTFQVDEFPFYRPADYANTNMSVVFTNNNNQPELHIIGYTYCQDGYGHNAQLMTLALVNGVGITNQTAPLITCEQLNSAPEGLYKIDRDNSGTEDILLHYGSQPSLPGIYFPYQSTEEYLNFYSFSGLGDIDSDGYVDLLAGGSAVFKNDGLGEFSFDPEIPLVNSLIGLLDVNNDGLNDQINIDYSDFTIYLNKMLPDGTLEEPIAIATYPSISNGNLIVPATSVDNEEIDYAILSSRWGDEPIYFIPFDPSLTGDVSGDGIVDINDFLIFVTAYGTSCENCPSDLDANGVVDVDDFLIFNTAFNANNE